MSAVIPFLRPAAARPTSWSQQELAEFYRVEAALLRAGIGIASEHGLSDEGEPWFVFCRPDGDEIMHFARIDGSYLIASEVLDRPVRGPDFRAMIDQIARLHPELLPIPAAATGTKLVVHPAALLAALVAAAALSLSSEDAHASGIEAGPEGVPSHQASDGTAAAHGQPLPARVRDAGDPDEQDHSRKQLAAVVLSAMIFAAEALAGDHHDASAETSSLLSDPASGLSSHMALGDGAPGSSVALGSGPGADATAQPAVQTAMGSGTSLGAVSAGGRIDAAPALRVDLSGDRAGAPGQEVAHHAPGFGGEAGLTGAPPGAAAGRTGGQQEAPGLSGTGDTTPDGSGAGGDLHAGSSPASAADSSALARSADAGQSDSGSDGAPQTWVNAGGHTVAKGAPAAAVTRDADDHGAGKGQGSRAEAAGDAGVSAKVEQGDHGSSEGHGPQAQSGSPTGIGPGTAGDGGDHGPASQSKAVPAAGGDPQAGGADDHGGATDPTQPGGHQAAAAAATDGDGPATGHGQRAGGSLDGGSDAAPSASSPAPAAPASPGHGPGEAAAAQKPDGGPGAAGGEASGSGTAADHPSAMPVGASQDANGPAADSAKASDPGPGHASETTVSADPQKGASPDAGAHGAASGDAVAPAPSESYAAVPDSTSHSHGAEPAPHGQAPAPADQGQPAQEGSGPTAVQEHPGTGAPPASAAQDVPAGNAHPQAGQAPPDHGAGNAGGAEAPATGQDAAHGPASGNPSGPQGGPAAAASPYSPASQADNPPVDHGQGQDGAGNPASGHAAHGSAEDPTGQAQASQLQVSQLPASQPLASQPLASQPQPGDSAAGPAVTPLPSGHAAPTTGQPAAARATVDASGNLVFHADTHPDPGPPPASHVPDGSAGHPGVGLVGISDQPHLIHDLYHHS